MKFFSIILSIFTVLFFDYETAWAQEPATTAGQSYIKPLAKWVFSATETKLVFEDGFTRTPASNASKKISSSSPEQFKRAFKLKSLYK